MVFFREDHLMDNLKFIGQEELLQKIDTFELENISLKIKLTQAENYITDLNMKTQALKSCLKNETTEKNRLKKTLDLNIQYQNNHLEKHSEQNEDTIKQYQLDIHDLK
jgi:carbonic anhydrase